MPHVSLSNQRNIYILQHQQSKSETERIFFENVVMFIDSIINSTGVDTIDCVPSDKVFLSGLKRDEILEKLGSPECEEYTRWDKGIAPTSQCVIVNYNGEFDIDDDRVALDDPVPDTNYFSATLKAWMNLMCPQGYSLVACDSLGQYAFFVRDVPSDVHGVNNLQLLYRSLHATLRRDEYFESIPNKTWLASKELLADPEDCQGAK